MGFGRDEPIEFEDRDIDINAPLSSFEKMLSYHEMSKEDFIDCSENEQVRLKWNYRKLGRYAC